MSKQPKVSIVVPIHNMKDGDKFLWRLVNSLTEQTFKDWELIITKDGKMAENTNSAMLRARGEYIKILYLDDYFSHNSALDEMVTYMMSGLKWMICGTNDNPKPQWTDDIETGNNKLGSPSSLMVHRDYVMYFDEHLSWLLDCELYGRMQRRLGRPLILEGNHVTIGKGDHQMTHILTDEEKLAEHKYIHEKYK